MITPKYVKQLIMGKKGSRQRASYMKCFVARSSGKSKENSPRLKTPDLVNQIHISHLLV